MTLMGILIMSKRNKKYNPLRAVVLENEKRLKNVCVSFFVNDNDSNQEPELIDMDGNVLERTPKLANAVQMFPYHWTVMLCIFCIEKGQSTIKMELAESPNLKRRDYQRNIVVALNELHQAFMKKQKALNVNVSGVGWVASPTGRDFDENEVGHIFERLNAF